MNVTPGFLGMRRVLGLGLEFGRPLQGLAPAPAPRALRGRSFEADRSSGVYRPSLDSRFPRFALGSDPGGSNAEILRAKGMLIRVRVGNATSVANQQASAGSTPGAAEEIVAMIDTGASISAIDAAVATRLGLVQTGSIQVGGVGGLSQQPVFAAALEIPDAGVTFDPLMLSGAQLGAPDFQMLVGRNLLCRLTLTYDGPSGQFALKHA